MATKNYRRKTGIFVRGSFSPCSSVECEDDYLANVTLENLKDRAVIIFAIYLKVGHNYYIEVENFEDKPLVLKGYEIYHREYGPIEFYTVSSDRIDLNNLLKDKKVKKQLILSTSDGKYKVPANIPRWYPVSDLFSNHMTALVMPVTSTYKGRYLGSNIKYIVELVGDNGYEEIVLIRQKDYKVKVFRNFPISKESLESKEALEQLLQTQLDDGALSCKKYIVHDVQAWREKTHSFYSSKTIRAEYYGAFQYHVMGRVFTKYSEWKLKRQNAQRKLSQ